MDFLMMKYLIRIRNCPTAHRVKCLIGVSNTMDINSEITIYYFRYYTALKINTQIKIIIRK